MKSITNSVYLYYISHIGIFPHIPLSYKDLSTAERLDMEDNIIAIPHEILLDLATKYARRIAHLRFPDLIVTEHAIITKTCKCCGTCYPISMLCGNKACKQCRNYIGYCAFKRLWDAANTPEREPSHIVTQVFPHPVIPITRLTSTYIKRLRQNFAKFRDRDVFKSKVCAGGYYIEVDFNLMNFTCRPHLHAIYETKIPACRNPMDFERMKRVWLQLMEVECEAPKRLQKYAREDLRYAIIYMIKEEKGEEHAIEMLTRLQDEMVSERAWSTSDIPDEYTAQLETIEHVLRHLTYVYNKAFRNQRRRGIFGSWRGKKVSTRVKAPWTCRECGAHDYVLTP